MTSSAETLVPDRKRLTKALSALANETRISVLEGIRSPKVLKEIRVHGSSGSAQAPAARLISRQAVKRHLDKLCEAGMVLVQAAKRDGEEVTEYVVNHQTLYALAERVRDLAQLRPVPEVGLSTMRIPKAGTPARRSGPGLTLIKGLDEGRLFPLMPPASGRIQWIVGRRRDMPVALDFDPFVSAENTAIHWIDGAYTIEDLPHSRNGTTLNFVPIEKGRRYPLASGDVVGVGRCFLLFRA